MLQTNNIGLCSQCLSHTGPAPTHGAHRSGSTLLRREPSEAGPRLHAPPQSKLLRLQVALARNRLRPALGCMHLPGLSRSGLALR